MATADRYSVKLDERGPGSWPRLKGKILDGNIQIGTFKRAAVRQGCIPPMEYKFFTSQSRNRFASLADCLSVEEIIEAMLPA